MTMLAQARLRKATFAPRRWNAWLLALVLGVALLAQAAQARAPVAAIVVDARTGKVLFARNADAARYPASISKVMTLYLLFREIRAGRLSLNSRLKVSRRASLIPPSKLWLKPGQSITVDQAIRALAVKSANDVATVVAENIAGSEAAFARRMTLMARAMGMTRTTFRNASGLPRPVNVSTARDMATLSLRLMRDFPKLYKRYFALKTFTWRGRALRNHNRLLWRVAGMDGIKTGYTRAAGFNLAASVRRNGRRIVAVVMSASTSRARNAYMARLIERTFRRHPLARGTRIAALAGRPPGYDSAQARVMLAKLEQLSRPRVAANFSARRKAATARRVARPPVKPRVRAAEATVVIPTRGQSLKLAKLALQAAVIPPVEEQAVAAAPRRKTATPAPKPPRRPARLAALVQDDAPKPAPRPRRAAAQDAQVVSQQMQQAPVEAQPTPRKQAASERVITARPLSARVAVRVPREREKAQQAAPQKEEAQAVDMAKAAAPAADAAANSGAANSGVADSGVAVLVKSGSGKGNMLDVAGEQSAATAHDVVGKAAMVARKSNGGTLEIVKRAASAAATGAAGDQTKAAPRRVAMAAANEQVRDLDAPSAPAAPSTPAAAAGQVAARNGPAEEIIFPRPDRARELMQQRWLIQIGAFPTIDGARTYLAKARRLSRNVRGRQPVVIRVRKGGNVFYRARYAGMSRKQAIRACRELKRRGLGCLPMAPGTG